MQQENTKTERSRRGVIAFVALAVTAGCSENQPTSEPDTVIDATPSDRTQSDSPTDYTGAEITRHLPDDPEGWTERRRPATEVTESGATASVLIVYERTDGVTAHVYLVTFQSAGAASRNARSWIDAGWQVTVAVENLLFAATTGTPDVTLTPEAPPQVPGTPVAGTEESLIELLAASPTLTAAQIREDQ